MSFVPFGTGLLFLWGEDLKMDLYSARNSDKKTGLGRKIIDTAAFVAAGVLFGIISKEILALPLDMGLWWGRLLSALEFKSALGGYEISVLIMMSIAVFSGSPIRAVINVFGFSAGSFLAGGVFDFITKKAFPEIDPKGLLVIAAASFAAYICWYAKGKGVLAFIINAALLCFMASLCFDIGIWHFALKGVFSAVVFAVSLVVLYKGPWQTVLSLLISVAAAFAVSAVI